jgi:hypothetical protein
MIEYLLQEYHFLKMEQIPKIPVYLYPFSSPPTHVIKLFNFTEKIPFSEKISYSTLCCTLGKKTDFFTDIRLVRLCEQLLEEQQPVYYIASSLAAKLLSEACSENKIDSIFQVKALPTVMSMINQYSLQFEEYVKKKRAIVCIQSIYLKNYYDPTTAFCKRRLIRQFEELQQLTMISK